MLQDIFERKHFMPFKAPINAPVFQDEKFVVINITNNRRHAPRFCAHISEVLRRHVMSAATFVVMISLVFDEGPMDARPVLNFLESSGFQLHYLVMCSSWFEKQVIREEDLGLLQATATRGRIHRFDLLVTQSGLRFRQRTAEVVNVINEVLAGNCQ